VVLLARVVIIVGRPSLGPACWRVAGWLSAFAGGMTGDPGAVAAGAAAPALAAVVGRIEQTAAGRSADREAPLPSKELVDCRSRHFCSEVGVGVAVGVFDDHDAFGGENRAGRCRGAEGVETAPGRPGQRATLGVGPKDGAEIGTQCPHILEPPDGGVDELDPATFGGDPHVQLLVRGEEVDLATGCDDDRVGQIDGRREGQPRKRFIDYLTHPSTCVISQSCVLSLTQVFR